MKNNITFLKNYFDKEIIVVSKNINIETFLSENNLLRIDVLFEQKSLKAGDLVLIKNNKKYIHVVKPGETILSISQKYNKSEEYIIKNNNLTKIFIGQQLFI